MNTLTANLHLLMCSFYKPTATKNKIILDWKAFPSDHFAVESQIRMWGYDPKECMVFITPKEGEFEVSTESILDLIKEHADSTALVMLPGIQYYTGQFFDIPRITKYAQDLGLPVGWDLAHAAGNVPLKLHDWNVDFAMWCTYKYMNAGPGAIGGAFIHERHGKVEYPEEGGDAVFRPRLSGWYGGDQQGRMEMQNRKLIGIFVKDLERLMLISIIDFRPSPGASGYQLSNPSVVDLSSLLASLSVFNQTSMTEIRSKSVHLTSYLEHLLLSDANVAKDFTIITPAEVSARGTQLSVLLKPGRLDVLSEMLEDAGIVADKRRPDVIRVAPVPLYNTYEEVWNFVEILKSALKKCDN